MTQGEPVWRSMLFVPAVNQRFVDGAAARGADAIILDLEDSIAPSQKRAARDALAGAIPIVSKGGADVLVRLNRPWRMLVRDLEAAVIPGVTALMVTKVDSPDFVQDVAGNRRGVRDGARLAGGRDTLRHPGRDGGGILPHG